MIFKVGTSVGSLISSTRYPRASLPILIIAWLSLAIFVLINLWTSYEVNRYPESIYIILFYVVACSHIWLLRKDIGVRLILLSIILPLLLFGVNFLINPEQALEFFLFDKLGKLTFFTATGFWLGGLLRNIYIFLIIVCLGLIIALFQIDIHSAYTNLLVGRRVDFGLQNAQHTAMFFGLAIIGLLAFFRDGMLSGFSTVGKLILIVIWIAIFTIALFIFIGTQTRGAYLGFIVVGACCLLQLLLAFPRLKNFRLKVKRLPRFVVVCVLGLGLTSVVTIVNFSDVIKNRIVIEKEFVIQLMQGNVTNIPESSVGIRVSTWLESVKWIQQKPLQGWGGDVQDYIIQNGNLSDSLKSQFGHFHNSYIEFTLAYGILGLSVLLYIFIWMNYRMYVLAKQYSEYRSVWHFTFYGSVFLAVINLFESYLYMWTGVYAMAVLLAPAYSLHLAELYKVESLDKKI